jgi:DNA-binding NarL/FixJ family response regulator
MGERCRAELLVRVSTQLFERASRNRHATDFGFRKKMSFRRPTRVPWFIESQLKLRELAMSGSSNHEIARMLGVSESAVKYHLRTLFDALDVSGRSGLVLELGEPALR